MIKLLRNRKGTAEIVGSVLFLVILLFFFTNVYLWHDQVTRQMDDVMTDRVNSRLRANQTGTVLQVTNEGGIGFSLSRLWIIKSGDHNYADFEKGQTIWVAAGSSLNITLGPYQLDSSDGSYLVDGWTSDPANRVMVHCGALSDKDILKILTTLGNTAACEYVLNIP